MVNKIAVVGMPQSGSTAIFNIVLNLLAAYTDKNVVTSLFSATPILWCTIPENERLLSTLKDSQLNNQPLVISNEALRHPYMDDKILLIKEHHYNSDLDDWADIVFVVTRDIRDSIVSRIRRGKKLVSKGQINEGIIWPIDEISRFKRYCEYLAIDCIEQWSSNKRCVINYEEYLNDPKSTITFIADKLVLKNSIDVDSVLEDSMTYYDHERWLTTFTESKITDKSKDVKLLDWQLKHITDNYKNLCFDKSEKQKLIKLNVVRTKYKSPFLEANDNFKNKIVQIMLAYVKFKFGYNDNDTVSKRTIHEFDSCKLYTTVSCLGDKITDIKSEYIFTKYDELPPQIVKSELLEFIDRLMSENCDQHNSMFKLIPPVDRDGKSFESWSLTVSNEFRLS